MQQGGDLFEDDDGSMISVGTKTSSRFSQINNDHYVSGGKNKKKEGSWRGLSFSEFADLLVLVANKKYYPLDSAQAYERLLLEVVLPRAKHRKIDSIAKELKEVNTVYSFLKSELHHIFLIYASRKQFMEWSQFWCLCREFGIVSSGGLLTAIDAADVFLASSRLLHSETKNHHLRPDACRFMNFYAFWTALVRCALFKFNPPGLRSDTLYSSTDRLKAFFLALFRQRVLISTDSNEQTNAPKNLRSDRLVKITNFKARFKLLWQSDGFRDYLIPNAHPPDTQAAYQLIDSLFHKQEADLLKCSASNEDDCHDEDPPVEIERDTEDIGDARFSVDDLEHLISIHPAIGRMLATLICKKDDSDSGIKRDGFSFSSYLDETSSTNK
eukprot:CAMPEP_0197319586 /NCGR_PEP_ID=MMETSP0891-20130614/55522_1 /TAXON_ID=44058 ORGANISM="Aureoumbra lagunensis, Strain CCMP1510" /NCGR_SAMPLE_ID=MMETSP0891 /ASSEMBLY_ACC=CAM_ASM_000534 /LENGTH=383 /DNA_ID=CAMNT_0042810597 /DNA_START=221 /DNA_END=1372 /DNA_ORIENTATION=+